MKKPGFFLMFALVLLTVSSAFASEIVPLQFSYSPIDFPNIFLLPNGYYQAVYFTPNSSEFWLEQGHTDVSNCIVEVFDAFGQSVWNFPVLQVDILQEDADAFFYQNEVRSDRIVFEYYWDHVFERYVSKSWSFGGERCFTSFDSILQPEEAFRYIDSQYPYTLEMWPFGEGHNVPAKLTYVPDGSFIELPFAYGLRATSIDLDDRYYMIYEADDIIEGKQGAVYLLSYSPDSHELAQYKTDLSSCAGNLAVSHGMLFFLQEKNQADTLSYELYTAALGDAKEDEISFTATAEIALAMDEVVENVIPFGEQLLFLKSKAINPTHYDSEICILSEDETLIPVTKWNGEARFLKNTTDPLQFACEDGNGGCQIVKLSEEEVCYFFQRQNNWF